jgi:hypothetical protein
MRQVMYKNVNDFNGSYSCHYSSLELFGKNKKLKIFFYVVLLSFFFISLILLSFLKKHTATQEIEM